MENNKKKGGGLYLCEVHKRRNFFPLFFFFFFKTKKQMSNESQPLLGHPDSQEQPTFWSSLKVTITSSYLNYFLIFVPIAIVFSVLNASPTVVFTLNFIAIIPLAKLLGFGNIWRKENEWFFN